MGVCGVSSPVIIIKIKFSLKKTPKKGGKRYPLAISSRKSREKSRLLYQRHTTNGRYSMQAQPAAVSCTNIEAFTGTCFPHIHIVRNSRKIRAIDTYSYAVYSWCDIVACCRLIQLNLWRNSWIRKPSSLRQYRRIAIVMS